jgi:hypothetical protein
MPTFLIIIAFFGIAGLSMSNPKRPPLDSQAITSMALDFAPAIAANIKPDAQIYIRADEPIRTVFEDALRLQGLYLLNKKPRSEDPALTLKITVIPYQGSFLVRAALKDQAWTRTYQPQNLEAKD